MAYTATFYDQSNTADWAFQVTAVDVDTDELVDFTDAFVSCSIMDKDGNIRLGLTEGDGITINGTTLDFFFAKGQISNLCGHYKIGCVYQKDDLTTQLFIGTVSFYDGIARI